MNGYPIHNEPIYNRHGEMIGCINGSILEFVDGVIRVTERLLIRQATIRIDGEPDRTVYLRHVTDVNSKHRS
jgi:hypothetical protein